MIFVTVGNATQPFARLVDGVVKLLEAGRLDDRDVVVQHGYTRATGGPWSMVPFLSHSEFEDHVRRADVVIAHAGCGTLLACARSGKVPVTVPRRKRLGEHVNDHQLQLATELAEQERVILCHDIDLLPQAIVRARSMRQPAALAAPVLPELVRSAIITLIENR